MIKIIRATTVPMSLDAFCKGMLNELSERYEMIALSSPGEEMEVIAQREGVRTIAVPMERHIAIWKDFVSLYKLVSVFRKEKPAMVHSMTPKAGLLCMLAGWITKVPVRVHTFTGLVFPTASGVKREVLMFTDRLTCACATHVIAEGQGVKSDLVNYGITKKPVRVLGYGNVKGVDLAQYSIDNLKLIIDNYPADERNKLNSILKSNNGFTFLFVGRIVKDKGINELVEAFARLHKEVPDTRLWLVGGYEEKLDPLPEMTKQEIDNNPAIEAVGVKKGDELLTVYAAADCFVLPSYREGFPNTVIEAGAMDLPSIVTDINGANEIIIQGENGVIVPPRDADALYRAMKAMIDDSEDRQRMAANSRRMVAERFEQSFVRKCLYDFYDEVLS